MKSLYEIIFKTFLKASLIPGLIVAMFLVITLFILNQKQNQKSEEELEKTTLASYEYIVKEKSDAVKNAFLNVIKDMNETKLYIEATLTRSKGYEDQTLALQKKGTFFLNDIDGKSSIYTTNIDVLTQNDKNMLAKLSLCEIYLETSVKNNNKIISSAWVNIDKRYSLAYPCIDVIKDVPSDLDVTKYAFYFDADEVHNPQKDIIFTATYKERWALDIGEIGAYLAPLYVNGKFIGTLGYNITIEEIDKILKDGAIQFSAIVLLMDNENNFLAASDEELAHKEFGVYSYFHNYKNQSKISDAYLNKIYPQNKLGEEDILRERVIPGTNLKLVLFGKYENVFYNIEQTFKETQRIDYIILFLIILVYIVFIMYAIYTTKKIAQGISKPIGDLAGFSETLGLSDTATLRKSSIIELNTLVKNLESANKNLTKLIIRDDLTRLYNRRKLLLDIKDADYNSTLILVDVNKFSHINSIYGSSAGDEVLKIVANRICHFMGSDLHVYRLEGDRFVALATNVNESYLDEFIEQISLGSASYNGVDIEINITIGAVLTCNNLDDLILKAEIALEEAKKTNSGGYVFYSCEMAAQKEFENNILWGNKIKAALKEDRITTYFQPIFNLKTNKIEKFESLVRLIEDGRVISPFYFLGPAKNVGLLSTITRKVVEKTFAVAQKYYDIEFSINLSLSDFVDEEFFVFIMASLEKFNLKSSQITLEMLETEGIDTNANPIGAINKFVGAGFKIAIDDFGSGYSNYSHLLNMDVDLLKIDGEFIKHIVHDQKSEKITLAILDFSKLLNTKTVAEFVADAAIFLKVKSMGVDYVQGYFISQPVDESELQNLLERFTLDLS